MCSVNTLLCINDTFDARGHDQPARTFERQVVELQIRAALLNRFTQLGRPQTVVVATVA